MRHRHATRDYIHVRDVGRRDACRPGVGEVLERLDGREIEVMEIFKLLAEVSGARVEPELVPLQRASSSGRASIRPVRSACSAGRRR